MSDLFEFSEQFRLIRFQLANWGTFNGIHDIDISEKGHLFVGGSGSGKSTLLDAMSVLLVPRRALNFNAAAREGEKTRGDRSFASYIRGAWSNQMDDHGQAETKFLREGTTWSAIALTYKSSVGRQVTFLFIGTIRGSARDENSVNQHFFFIPHEFSLTAIRDFSKADLSINWAKKQMPDCEYFSRFNPFCECLMRYFGIKNDTVLKLLHKAQSAKNLGDINDFLRDYMLETPGTFEIADTLVDEFSQLNSAWLSVCKARAQIEVLVPARVAKEESEKAARECEEQKALKEYVHYWQALIEHDQVMEKLPAIQEELALNRGSYDDKTARQHRISDRIDELKRLRYENGGAQIERLSSELNSARQKEKRVDRDAALAERSLSQLSLTLPNSALEWEQTMLSVRERAESSRQDLDHLRAKREETISKRKDNEDRFAELRREIDAMQAHKSNIPGELLELRQEFCDELGLSELDLPFAGELMQVKDEERQWQGALERVVHQFALSILVSDDHYQSFARLVNSRHLGTRLVYHRVTDMAGSYTGESDDNCVPSKFDLKQGPWKQWVKSELDRRFNYACIEDTRDLDKYERAVTIQGQVKHSRTRHEKDDRHKLTDPMYWVTGFSNHEKLKLYTAEAHKCVDRIERYKKVLRELDEQDSKLRDLQGAAKRLEDIVWADIDRAAVLQLINDLEKALETAKIGNRKLNEIDEELKAEQVALAKIEAELQELLKERGLFEGKERELKTKLENAKLILAGGQSNEKFNKMLERAATTASRHIAKSVTPNMDENIASMCVEIMRMIGDKINTLSDRAGNQQSKMLQVFSDFMHQWPDETSELTAEVSSANEFMAKLTQLENDGLPKYEQRFRELLENTTSQNLIDLNTRLEDERRSIKDRLKEVNTSLSLVPFNRLDDKETHLRISVDDRNLPEVREFRSLYKKVMHNETETLTEELAERRFEQLKKLVNKLAGGSADGSVAPTLADKRWRDNVLDVRMHVEFHGEEYDNEDKVIEIYESGSGKSGGQRQKLTTTCLAAALRYQLGGTADTMPKFAPVVLDEAFDKADSDFTDISLQIFEQFGFQLIIATPLKGVHTIEPYIGKTDYVVCHNRNDSHLQEIDLKVLTGEESADQEQSLKSETSHLTEPDA